MPGDVRLMNVTAVALAVLAGAAARRRGAALAGAPAAVRDPRHHASTATSAATASRPSAPTPRRGSPATSSRSTSARCARAFESVPWVRHAVVRRVWPNRLRGAARGAPRRSALWGSDERATRSWSTASARCSRPTSATSRTTTLPTLDGPGRQRRRRCWRCTRTLGRRVRADRDARRGAAALGPRLVAGDARHRRGGRARPRQRRRGGGAHGALRRARVRQVTARYQRPLEYADLRHPDGYAVRLKGVSTHDRRRRQAAEEVRRAGAAWPRNSRISSSDSTSAPPR